MNWRQLFTASKNHSFQFFPPTVNDGEVAIKPHAEVFEAGVRVWQNTLVSQFLGKPPNLNTLRRLINVIWGKYGELEVNSAVWVHLRSMPLELFTSVGLSYRTSALGVPLYMDSITTNRQRLAYAKVCVEMSAGVCVPKVIPVYLKDGSVALVGVEVPWLPPRCSHCCIFGHAENLCKVGHEPSKVWIPKASIATDDVVKGKRIVTSKDVDIASSSMGCVLPVAGNVTGENNGLGVTTYNVGIVLDSSSDQGVRDLVTQGVVLGLDLASLYGEVVHDVAGSVAQGVVDKVVQGAADYAQVQVSAIVLDVGAATQDVVGVELANAPTDIGVVVAFDGTDGSPKQIREVAKGVVDLVQEIKNAKRNGKKGRKKGVGNNPSHS
ncbi:hypothetical protein V6N13_020833 [Hibiscus sabdariffa]